MKRGVALLLLFAAALWADPRLDDYRDVEGVRLYRDHLRSDTWYLQPAEPVLAEREGRRDFSFDVYRYLGRKGSGDQGAYWLRGIMTIGIARKRDEWELRRIREALQREGVRDPVLRSLPVTEAVLDFAVADQHLQRRSGGRWSDQAVTIVLDPVMTQLLIAALEEGQGQISLGASETVRGVLPEGKEWREANTTLASALAISIPPEAAPEHLHRFDLGARMRRGYGTIDVFCFDFVEDLEPELYSKIVEVAIPTAGRPLVEKIAFDARSDYRGTVKFRLSKEREQPYRYRITRIGRDGSTHVGEWIKREGEQMLDVTNYKEGDDE
jgi:hypothetical protein